MINLECLINEEEIESVLQCLKKLLTQCGKINVNPDKPLALASFAGSLKVVLSSHLQGKKPDTKHNS